MPYVQEVCVAGKTIEVSKYYSIRYHAPAAKRSENVSESTEKQKELNNKRAEKELRLLMNTNFQDGDLLVRLDFYKNPPKDSIEMQEMTAKAIRKMRREFKKAGLEMKYIYVKEVGPRGSRHIHMMLSKCDTDLLTKCWPYGGVHIDPLNTDGQYRKVAAYFIKYEERTEATEGERIGKRWYGSRNLEKPKIKKKVITAGRFRRVPMPLEGYYLDKETEVYGISEETGFEFYRYTLIRLPGKGGSGGSKDIHSTNHQRTGPPKRTRDVSAGSKNGTRTGHTE